MFVLILGLLLFFLPHLLRETGLREPLRSALGSEAAYKGLYSMLAMLGLALAIYGKSIAPFQMVWAPLYDLRWLSHWLMVPAIILLLAGNLPRGHLAAALRHPMLAGVAIWGLAHLWSNGDLASILLFGGFALWSVFKFISLSLRGPGRGRPPRLLWDIVALMLGLTVYLLIFVFHGQIFGIGLTLE